MYQEIHPHRAISIDSVKSISSLLMMRECEIFVEVWVGWVLWFTVGQCAVDLQASVEVAETSLAQFLIRHGEIS